VHENVTADFVHMLLKNDLPQSFQAVPIGSTDPMPLKSIIQRLADETEFKGEIKWQVSDSSPFSIDSSAAIKLGYKPLSTQTTLDHWMHDARH
jgi:hypothetical protein